MISLKFGIGKSLRYHGRRRSFFGFLRRSILFISLLGGSSAFFVILTDFTEIAKWLSLAIAIAAASDLTIGYGDRERHYDNLYRRYAKLLEEITNTPNPRKDQVQRWKATRVNIEEDEPTPLAALNVLCHNEEAEAQGYGSEHLYLVRWYQALFAHFATLPPNNFPRK